MREARKRKVEWERVTQDEDDDDLHVCDTRRGRKCKDGESVHLSAVEAYTTALYLCAKGCCYPFGFVRCLNCL